ncbi:MAG: suppressor of lin2 (SelL), partial [Solimicrobium sp.]|nr:suppressor of lin2 (SelL) [Solimicrobium sp.]
GLMYENGLGVSQDFREARACYEIAAKQGSAAAVYNLGVLYQLGLSVSQDFKEALFRYKTAAEMKCVQAFFNMGLLYRYGLGVQPDEEKAQECFDKAVALEDTGFNSLDEFREHLCTKALAWLENKNYTGAFNKFLLLAQTHHPEAQFQLGLMYMKGLGVKHALS